MKRFILSPAFAIVLGFCALPCHGQTIPPVKTKALDDSEVVLPKPGGQQLFVLVLGFSHKSGENCTPWDKRLAADYLSDPHVTYYQLPVLAGVPSFVRPMILHGMRKEVPAAQHSHFVPIYDHEADWKKLVHFSAPDDPYILLVAPDGHTLWQTHGPVTDSAYSELKSAVTQFSAKSQLWVFSEVITEAANSSRSEEPQVVQPRSICSFGIRTCASLLRTRTYNPIRIGTYEH